MIIRKCVAAVLVLAFVVSCASEREGGAPAPAPGVLILEPPASSYTMARMAAVQGEVVNPPPGGRLSYEVRGTSRTWGGYARVDDTGHFSFDVQLLDGANSITVFFDVGGKRIGAAGVVVHAAPDAPRIVEFSVTPEDVLPGDPVEIRWATVGTAERHVEWRQEPYGPGEEVEWSGRRVVHPDQNRSYGLRVRDHLTAYGPSLREDAWVEVRVRPSIVPAGGVIAAWTQDGFHVEGGWAARWLVDGRERSSQSSLAWTPAAPGHYEIQAVLDDGRELRHRLEVRELQPDVSIRPAGAPSGAWSSIVRGHGGDLFVSTGSLVFRRRAADGSWHVVGRNGPGLVRLASAPNGTLWAHRFPWNTRDGGWSSSESLLFRYEPDTDRWEEEPYPMSSRCSIVPGGILAASAGELFLVQRCASNEGSRVLKRTVGGVWTALQGLEGFVTDAARAPSGAIHVIAESRGSPRLLATLQPGATEWEASQLQVPQNARLHAAHDGTVYVYGNALLARLQPDGNWEDLSDRLPCACRVRAMAVEGTKLLVAMQDGLYALGDDGSFLLRAALPDAWGNPGDLQLESDGAGTCLAVVDGTIWLLPAGTSEWLLASSPASGGLLAAAPDGTVFADASGAAAFSLLRRGVDGSWTRLASNLTEETRGWPTGLVPQEDGSVVFAYRGRLYRVDAGAEAALEVAIPASGPVEVLEGTPQGLLVMGSEGGWFVSRSGGGTWEQMSAPPLGAPAVDRGRIVAGSPEGPVEFDDTGNWRRLGYGGPRDEVRALAHDVTGRPWILAGWFVWRLDGQRWTRVGMGSTCGVRDLALRGDGTAVLVCHSGDLFVLDPTGAWLPLLEGGIAHASTVLPDGRLLLWMGGAGYLFLE